MLIEGAISSSAWTTGSQKDLLVWIYHRTFFRIGILHVQLVRRYLKLSRLTLAVGSDHTLSSIINLNLLHALSRLVLLVDNINTLVILPLLSKSLFLPLQSLCRVNGLAHVIHIVVSQGLLL